MHTELPFIKGNGEYSVNVAGESFYPASFHALVGPHGPEGANIHLLARLILQDDNPHDSKAVQVTINGLPVGHLRRAHARAFRRTVRYGQLAEHEVFQCAALICGGWATDSGSSSNYGVRLDLELEVEE